MAAIYAVATCFLFGCEASRCSTLQHGDPVVEEGDRFPDIEWIRGDVREIVRGGNYCLIGKDSSGYFLVQDPLGRSLMGGVVERAESVEGVRSWVADAERYPNLGFASNLAAAVAWGVPLSREERDRVLIRTME